MKVTHNDLTTSNIEIQSSELRLKTAVILSYIQNGFGLSILVLIHLIAVYLVCTPFLLFFNDINPSMLGWVSFVLKKMTYYCVMYYIICVTSAEFYL